MILVIECPHLTPRELSEIQEEVHSHPGSVQLAVNDDSRTTWHDISRVDTLTSWGRRVPNPFVPKEH